MSRFPKFCITTDEDLRIETSCIPLKSVLRSKLINFPLHREHAVMNLYRIVLSFVSMLFLKKFLYTSIYKEGLSRTVVREVLLRATTHRHQTFPDYRRHTRSRSKGATCAKKPLPRSARRKTSKRTSAILDLRIKYTFFRACSYAANTKEEPKPLFTNSSRERRRKAPKRFQLSHAVRHINIKW